MQSIEALIALAEAGVLDPEAIADARASMPNVLAAVQALERGTGDDESSVGNDCDDEGGTP